MYEGKRGAVVQGEVPKIDGKYLSSKKKKKGEEKRKRYIVRKFVEKRGAKYRVETRCVIHLEKKKRGLNRLCGREKKGKGARGVARNRIDERKKKKVVCL